MASASRTTLDAVLKEDYQPMVRDQLNNDIPMLANIEKDTESFEGRAAVLALHVRRNSGVGARAEAGTLPTAGSQTYVNERVSCRFNYARGQITKAAITASKSDKGSFTRGLESELKGLTTDLKRDVARQVWGTSDGAIAPISLSSNTSVISLAAASAVQIRQLDEGGVYDIGFTTATTNIATAATIVAVGSTSVTIDSTVTTGANAYFFRSGAGGGSTSQKELTGLQTIVSDAGSLFNVDPATYSQWKSTVKSNSGTNRQISENLMAQTVQAIQISSGQYPNMAVVSDGVNRSYAALLQSQKRFPNTIDLKGGYKGLDFTAAGPTIPVVWDRDCPANKVFFLNTDHLKEFVQTDWEFEDDDGAVLRMAGVGASGVHSFEFFLYKFHELATDQRNAHGLLSDITES